MKTSRFSSLHAFTYLEVITAMIVFGFAMAGALKFFYFESQVFYENEVKLMTNHDVRYVMQNMLTDSRSSNLVMLYQSFYPYTTPNNVYPYTGTNIYNKSGQTNATPYIDGGATLDPGDEILNPFNGVPASGDYVVFVTYADPFVGYNPTNDTSTVPGCGVTRLILYWIGANRAYPGEWAMYRFDSNSTNGVLPWNVNINLQAADAYGIITGYQLYTTKIPNAQSPATQQYSGPTLESILPSSSTAAYQEGEWGTGPTQWATIILNDVRGEALPNYGIAGAASAQGYNFTGYSYPTKEYSGVVMRSLILHNYSAKHITDTYNFTLNTNG